MGLRALEFNASSDHVAACAALKALSGSNCIKRYAQYDLTNNSEEKLAFERKMAPSHVAPAILC
ncbi:hypothetical protein ANO14919_080150 [Xylariales sp. No.14919]|nr:hypothetical protein ANO14919_080150 [Xylariales sp. No.14919]